MDEDSPMNKNIRILVVNNNNENTSSESLTAALESMHLTNVVMVTNSKEALKTFVHSQTDQPFDVTMIHDLGDMDELELLKSLIEINPDHYVIMLTDTITPEKVLNSIKFGANGILSKPFTADKIQMELEKYKLLREDKKTMYS
jgi:DNA-binding NtrC family response regulator